MTTIPKSPFDHRILWFILLVCIACFILAILNNSCTTQRKANQYFYYDQIKKEKREIHKNQHDIKDAYY